MIEMLIAIARAVRAALYRLSSARILGVDVDVVLHFGLSALIFTWAERRFGARRAAWILASMIIAKEIADLFLKSQLRYIRRPTPAMLVDIGTDILTGMAGGLLAWLLRRRAVPRGETPPAGSS
jgi:hypothetical protein